MNILFKTTQWLYGLAIFFIVLNFIAYFTNSSTGYPVIDFVLHISQLDEEKSLPTVFAAGMHLLCGLLLIYISTLAKRLNTSNVLNWLGLGALFIFLAAEEAKLRIHERSGLVLNELLGNPEGILYHSWVIFGVLFVGLVLALNLKFLNDLNYKIRRRIILAGLVFVSGAIGFEMLGSAVATLYTESSFVYFLCTTLEESLELFGLILFIAALLKQIEFYHSENLPDESSSILRRNAEA